KTKPIIGKTMKAKTLTLLLCACTATAALATDVTGDRLNIGSGNTISGTYTTIAGGNANSVDVQLGVIGGGQYNTNSGGVDGGWDTIGGGYGNLIHKTSSSTVG